MKTYYISRIGIVEKNNTLHQQFTNTFLDYKRDRECRIVHALFQSGNKVLAVVHHEVINQIINEQMFLKYA